MGAQLGHGAQAHVRQRTHRQCDAVLGEVCEQFGVVDGTDAVVHPLDLEKSQRLPDVRRRCLLAGVGDATQSQLGCPAEHALEQRWRVADLRGVQTDAEQLVGTRRDLVEEGFGRGDRVVADDADDESAGNAEPLPPDLESRAEPSMTTSTATPFAACTCGSKNIST